MFEVKQSYPENGQHTGSYYAASANPSPKRAAVAGRIDVDVAVVGAGFSGLSTALHLAERGHQVAVIEGARVGWGASGRNGGQIVNGLNAGLDRIEKRFGREKAYAIGKLVQEGGSIIREKVATYSIDCDLKPLNVFTAYTASHMRDLEAKKALWQQHGIDNHIMLDRHELRDHVGSDVYAGGMLDTTGGHIHPLNLALGEAAAIESLGGRVYEHSVVTEITHEPSPVITTEHGTVHCKTLVLCGNAYLGTTEPALTSRVMPVSTQIIATEPLDEAVARSLLPTDACIEDVRYILDYFRLSADNRLLFGGGTVYGGTDPADVKMKLQPAMLRVFPQLKEVNIDFAWSGNFALSYSRVPQMGKLARSVYFAHGYSGHGVTGSHLFGRILADAIDGDLTGFAIFEDLPWVPFPGGRRFRAPYSTIGSWWYGLRDKLGV